MVPAITGCFSTSWSCKESLIFKNVSKSLKKARLELWCDGESEAFNVKYTWNSILAKEYKFLIQNYKRIIFSGLPVQDIFPHNKRNFLDFSRNILGNFHCILVL